jgi:uncharacterized membrane protein YfcA
MDTPTIGSIAGSVLGILGGVVGTYFSIRNTNSRRERRFVVRVAILVWLALGMTALAVFYRPTLRAWAWVPIGVMAVVGVPLGNRRQEMIRREEARK